MGSNLNMYEREFLRRVRDDDNPAHFMRRMNIGFAWAIHDGYIEVSESAPFEIKIKLTEAGHFVLDQP